MTQVTKGLVHIRDCALVVEDSNGECMYDLAAFVPDPRDFIREKRKVQIVYELLYEGELLPVLWYIHIDGIKLIKF